MAVNEHVVTLRRIKCANDKSRNEWLNARQFLSIAKARSKIGAW